MTIVRCANCGGQIDPMQIAFHRCKGGVNDGKNKNL